MSLVHFFLVFIVSLLLHFVFILFKKLHLFTVNGLCLKEVANYFIMFMLFHFFIFLSNFFNFIPFFSCSPANLFFTLYRPTIAIRELSLQRIKHLSGFFIPFFFLFSKSLFISNWFQKLFIIFLILIIWLIFFSFLLIYKFLLNLF